MPQLLWRDTLSTTLADCTRMCCTGKHASSHVVELDKGNFEDLVLTDDAVWIVEFYSDKCPVSSRIMA